MGGFLENYQIKTLSHLQRIFSQGINSDNDKDNSLSLKPPDLALLLNHFDKTSPENSNDHENAVIPSINMTLIKFKM